MPLTPVNKGILLLLGLFHESNSIIEFNMWGTLAVGRCSGQDHDLNMVSCSGHLTLYRKLLSNGTNKARDTCESLILHFYISKQNTTEIRGTLLLITLRAPLLRLLTVSLFKGAAIETVGIEGHSMVRG